tara:strand:+ start:570 stop:1271 length:702 start_codon:yes stop_codon:yes gene_type:complete
MESKIRRIIENSVISAKKQKREFLLFSRIIIFIQDPLISENVDFDEIISTIEQSMPSHLFDNIDIIYVGQHDELTERELEAFYDSGAVYITNTLSDNIDYVENIIHENAHAIEERDGLQIYGDQKIQTEFIGKRKRLFHKIKSAGYDISDIDFMNSEFQTDLDDFLYREIGYDNLNYLINGIFVNPYAATSINEYFSSGVEKYFLNADDRQRLRSFSPELTKKIEELINGNFS